MYLALLFWLSNLWPWCGYLYETSHHMPKPYICCILPISQISSKDNDLGWPLTHFSRSHRSSWPWTLLVSAILPQQNIISMPKRYIWWVLSISNMFWPLTYFSRSDMSVRLVCLSIQFLPAYIHDWHQTITAYLPCPVLVPSTIILDLRPLTVAWWPLPWLCLLPQNCQNKTFHQCQNGTFAAFCKYLRWVWRAVTLVDHWPTF